MSGEEAAGSPGKGWDICYDVRQTYVLSIERATADEEPKEQRAPAPKTPPAPMRSMLPGDREVQSAPAFC